MRVLFKMVGIVGVLLSLVIFAEALSVPAFVAGSYFMFSAMVGVGSAGCLYLGRNKKKSLIKAAKEAAEIENFKNEILKLKG